jgi:hypothetical protein
MRTAGSKPTSNFLPCGSRLPLIMKRKPTIALLSKLRRPLNVIHGNDRFTSSTEHRAIPVAVPTAVRTCRVDLRTASRNARLAFSMRCQRPGWRVVVPWPQQELAISPLNVSNWPINSIPLA